MGSGGNGHWYEAVYANVSGVTWSDARNAAAARGGYLASVTSAAENGFVYGLVATDGRLWACGSSWNHTQGPWLGGYQYDELAEPSGHWTWVSGEPWSYTNWAGGEPNNFNGHESWLCYYSDTAVPAPTWNDSPNEGYSNWNAVCTGYVVEYNAVPEPSIFVLLGIGAFGLLVRGRRRRSAASARSPRRTSTCGGKMVRSVKEVQHEKVHGATGWSCGAFRYPAGTGSRRSARQRKCGDDG